MPLKQKDMNWSQGGLYSQCTHRNYCNHTNHISKFLFFDDVLKLLIGRSVKGIIPDDFKINF